jgi:hypothetical protein
VSLEPRAVVRCELHGEAHAGARVRARRAAVEEEALRWRHGEVEHAAAAQVDLLEGHRERLDESYPVSLKPHSREFSTNIWIQVRDSEYDTMLYGRSLYIQILY